MKTVTQYICETCGTSYGSEKMAAQCEAKHVKPKIDDVQFFYKPITMNEVGMPYKIVIRDNNGNAHTYKE